MSKKSLEKITCPWCNTTQNFIVWNSVNTLLDPDMKEKVLDKSIFNITCVKCHTSSLVQYSLLYHDQRERFMIWLIPSEEDNRSPEIPENVVPLPGYKLRLVKTINRLIEKIFILDLKLDDRIIELIKYKVWKERLRLTVAIKDIYFSKAFLEEDKIALILEMIDRNGNHSALQVGGKYGDFPINLNNLFEQKAIEKPGWQWIDFNFPDTFEK